MTAEAADTQAKKGVLDHVETASLVGAGGSLAAVVLVQAWQVFARYVLNASPSWTEPAALVLIGSAAMLGAAVCVRRESHFAFPTLADAAPPVIREACRAIARLAMMGLGLGLAWYGYELTAFSWDLRMAGTPGTVGVRYIPIALGGVLIALFAGERLYRQFTDRKARPEHTPVVVEEV